MLTLYELYVCPQKDRALLTWSWCKKGKGLAMEAKGCQGTHSSHCWWQGRQRAAKGQQQQSLVAATTGARKLLEAGSLAATLTSLQTIFDVYPPVLAVELA